MNQPIVNFLYKKLIKFTKNILKNHDKDKIYTPDFEKKLEGILLMRDTL